MLINFGCGEKKLLNENTLYEFIDRINSHIIRITYNLLLAQQSTHSDMQILCHSTVQTYTDTRKSYDAIDVTRCLAHRRIDWTQ